MRSTTRASEPLQPILLRRAFYPTMCVRVQTRGGAHARTQIIHHHRIRIYIASQSLRMYARACVNVHRFILPSVRLSTSLPLSFLLVSRIPPSHPAHVFSSSPPPTTFSPRDHRTITTTQNTEDPHSMTTSRSLLSLSLSYSVKKSLVTRHKHSLVVHDHSCYAVSSVSTHTHTAIHSRVPRREELFKIQQQKQREGVIQNPTTETERELFKIQQERASERKELRSCARREPERAKGRERERERERECRKGEGRGRKEGDECDSKSEECEEENNWWRW